MTCDKYFGDRLTGVDSVGGRKLPFPIDKARLALPRTAVSDDRLYCRTAVAQNEIDSRVE